MTKAMECAEIARGGIDALNAHDPERFSEMFDENSETLTVPTGERSFGPSGAREDVSRWMRAFPDVKLELVTLMAADDAATLELKMSGTHTGPLALPEGEIPATGRPVEQRLCVVLRFEDGKIVSEHDYFDVAGMMRQLDLGAAAPKRAAGEQRPTA